MADLLPPALAAAAGKNGPSGRTRRAAVMLIGVALLCCAAEYALAAFVDPLLRSASLLVKMNFGGEIRYGSLFVFPGIAGLKGRICGVYAAYPFGDFHADIPDCVKFYLPYYGEGAVVHVPAPARYSFSKGARVLTLPEGGDVALTFEGAASCFGSLADLAAGKRHVKTLSLHASSARLTTQVEGAVHDTGVAVNFGAEWTSGAPAAAGRGGVSLAPERGLRFSAKGLTVALPFGYDSTDVFPASVKGQARVAAVPAGSPGELRLDGLLLDFGSFAFRLLGDVRAAEGGDLFPSASLRLEVTDLDAASASSLVSAVLKLPASRSPERSKAVSAFLRRYAEKPREGQDDGGAVFLLERPRMGELTFGGSKPQELAKAWQSLVAEEGRLKPK